MNIATIVRYLISGGAAAVVNLATLYVCTDMLHLWYILSALVAFVFAFFVSFYLQRSWTFKETSQQLVKKQLTLFFITAIWNIILNMLILYVFVEYFHLHYFFAQFITLGLIAIQSFFIYRLLIFVSRNTTPA